MKITLNDEEIKDLIGILISSNDPKAKSLSDNIFSQVLKDTMQNKPSNKKSKNKA